MNLQDILQRKPQNLITVRASDSILKAMRIMCESHVGSILVESDDGRILGITTERDILRFCSDNQGIIEDTLIDNIMTRNLIIATPDYSLDEAMSLMTEHRFRHLPVMQAGKTIGIISIGDLVKAKLKDVSVEVKYLRDYISA